MFGSMLRDFEEDPFFRSHNEIMSNFMRDFDRPFRNMFPALEPPMRMNHQHGIGSHHRHNELALQPHGMFNSMFGQMGSMFANMERQFEGMSADPNCHSFSSSTVMTYSNDGRGAPKVYQSSSSTRQAPGGIKETRKTERDFQTGTNKIAIGHHIGERSHVIERSRNTISGEEEEKQDFLNMDETDAEAFDREWRTKTRTAAAGIGYGDARNERQSRVRAIEGAAHSEQPTRRHLHRQREDDILSVRGRQYERNGDWDANDRRNHHGERKVRINSRPTYR